MHQLLLANPLIAAALAVATALFLLGGLKFGLALTTLTLTGLAVCAAVLAWLVFLLNGKLKGFEREGKAGRTAAERMQAMLTTVPGGYCLFTPQGLLRETARAPQILGVPKLAHVEDIVAVLKDAPPFLAAFARLQQIGQSFGLATALTDGRQLQISGRRIRIGREGPLVDVLWFVDSPGSARVIDQQSAELTHVTRRARDIQGLIDSLPIPVWTRSADLDLVFCNRAYAKALDASPEDTVREQAELTSPTARSGSGRALAGNALNSNQPQVERRHVIIAGKRRLLEITERPISFIKSDVPADDVAAKPPVLLGFAIDVTAEEDKDTELQRHIGAQHDVLEHLGSAIAVYGPDRRLQFYNRAYQRLWDADEAFLNTKPDFGEVLEDLRTRRRAPEQADFQRYKKERLSLFTSLLESREDSMHLPDGTTLRILAVPHPFGGIMFVHEDVTDKLALESSYNTLIAVQRETLDNLAEGIAVFGPDGKLRLFNPAFIRIWQLPADFLEQHPHIADLLEHMKPLFDFGANWASFKGEMVEYTLDRSPRRGRIERADGTVVEYSAVPLPDGAVLNSYLDVTDSIKMEQALRASNAALATADRLKSEFVANVSYQLRTPLNTVMGFAEILTNQYFGALNDRQLEYTRTIMDASKRLLLLINDVLDLATIEAGRMALNRSTLGIADLLNAAKQMSAEWARQQSLEIIIDCPSGIGSLSADEHRMKQVLFNLISNAVKYTESGGRITLQARRQGEQIVLAVSDTGIGIPMADVERVFGKFERSNAQARQAGAGLGLSLVKSFVELHGGHIEIESEVNQGTKVSLFLPIKPPAELEAGGAQRMLAG